MRLDFKPGGAEAGSKAKRGHLRRCPVCNTLSSESLAPVVSHSRCVRRRLLDQAAFAGRSLFFKIHALPEHWPRLCKPAPCHVPRGPSPLSSKHPCVRVFLRHCQTLPLPLRSGLPPAHTTGTMPCYKLIVWSRPEATPAELAKTFRGLAKLVYREQGQFRTLANKGVRPLAWPIRKPYEKFDEARLVECSFDVSPSGKEQLEGFLTSAEEVLAFTHLRDDGPLASFKRGTRKVRTKPVTAQMLSQGVLFDPETMKPTLTSLHANQR